MEQGQSLLVPAEAVAPRVTVPVPQVDPGVTSVIVGMVFTVAVTAVLEAVVQPMICCIYIIYCC